MKRHLAALALVFAACAHGHPTVVHASFAPDQPRLLAARVEPPTEIPVLAATFVPADRHAAPPRANRSTLVPRGTPATTRRTAPPVRPAAPPAPPVAAPSGSALPAGLLCIRHRESTDNYRARSGPYSGAYQYDTQSWAGYGGYGEAGAAPPSVQDAKALAGYNEGTANRHHLWPNTSRACGV